MRGAVLALACLWASSAAAAPLPITLPQSFELALKRSEALAQSGEAVAELQGQVGELWSNVKPRVSLVGLETLQDVPAVQSGVATTFTQRTREQAQVSLHQPLFAGLREYLAVRAAQARGEAAELSLRRARQLLYADVANAYVSVLSVSEEEAVRRAVAQLTDDRIKELRSREKLGRSRHSEVLAVEAQRAQIAAQLETALGRARQAQFSLRFLTGAEEDLAPAPLAAPPAVEPLSHWLALCVKRPDVEAARLQGRAAQLSVDVYRRSRWPTLALDGNYYLRRPPGFTDKVKWDALFTASLPLYNGGQISSQVKQAQARKRSAEQGLSLAERRAALETSSAHSAADSAVSIVAALERATAAAEANAKAQAEDYRLGLVTNLDVLGSLNALLDSRLSLSQARLQAVLARAQLSVAAGAVEGL